MKREAAGPHISRQALAHLVVLLAVLALIAPILGHAVEVWSADEEFSYGFLIPPITLALLWWKRAELRQSVGPGRNSGLLLVLGAVVLILVSRRMSINVLAGIAVAPLLIGAAAYLWGWRTARGVVFPSVFLLFGLALYRGLLSSIGFVLQEITATGAHLAARTLGLDVARDGLVLHSVGAAPGYAFEVAQACSGMSSLLSLLALAALLVFATRGRLVGRIAVLAGVLPLVIIANTARVSAVLVVADWLGQDAALGFFHGASSLVLFGVALAGMLLLSRTVGCRLPSIATSP